MRAWVLSIAMLTLSACANAKVEHEHGDHRRQFSFVAGEAPDPASCPASSLREVRYGTTVGPNVELDDKLANKPCVADLRAALEHDIACANAFNSASWQHALAGRGLQAFEATEDFVGLDGQFTPGSVHPHPDESGQQVVFLGYDGSDCSATSVYTRANPGITLTRNTAGEVVVVRPRPQIESRNYPNCGCDPGCGAYLDPMPRFAVLDAQDIVAETIELTFPAIEISGRDVDTQTCCCAP